MNPAKLSVRYSASCQWLPWDGLPRSILGTLIAVGIVLSSGRIHASNAAAQEPDRLAPLNRFPRMVQEYFVARGRAIQQQRSERLRRVDSRHAAQEYIDQVRAAIRESFGQLPERTPLHARTTGIIEQDGYRIEKVLFQSRPNFWVTANLYVPTDRTPPMPAVLGTCGHSDNGKAAAPYQAFCQGLVKQGFVVLIFDPISQGERLQYVDSALESSYGPGVREHLQAGNQQFLIGEFFGTWRAWDAIRALDYLLARPEVDPQRVGITGNSGGGTMTTWLAALDDRFTMAAPSCFVTSFQRNLENELPADTEQCPPGALARLLDHADFLAAMAPRPVIVLTKERDYFDVRGSERALLELKSLYQWLDAADQVAHFSGPSGHGYSQENREAMYAWFRRLVDSPASADEPLNEPPLNILNDEQLLCTPDGQVARLGSRPIYDFTAEKARSLAAARRPLQGEELRRAMRQLLRLEVSDESPDYRILRPAVDRGFPRRHFTTYAIESEPGIHAIVYRLSDQPHFARPPQGNRPAVLYVSHVSSDEELRGDTWLRHFIDEQEDVEVFACDVRGTGESQPDTCGEKSFFQPYGSDYFYAIHAIMFGDPYPGQKTRDLLRVIHWLKEHGHHEIHVVAQRRGTIPAAIAALLTEDVQRITLRRAPASYQQIAESASYTWPLSSFIPGALGKFDLTDMYQELARTRERVQIETADTENEADDTENEAGE